MTLRMNLVNLAWDPVSGSTGYDILLDDVKVSRAGPKAKTTKITIPEGAKHKVTIKAQPSGQMQEAKFEWSSIVDAPPPPPPPPTGTTRLLQTRGDFSFFWNEGPAADGAGIAFVSTPHGNGLRIASSTLTPASWDATSKMVGAVYSTPASEFVGKRQVYTWHEYFPSSGNVNGFPKEWTSGLLLEFQVAWGSIGPHLVITNGSGAGPTFRVGVEKPGIAYDFFYSNPVPMDSWIPIRFEIVWDSTAGGYTKWTINGQTVVEVNRATLFGGGVTGTIMAYYSANQLFNEHTMAGMQVVTS